MELSTLLKFQHKIRLFTTPKHPLYFESPAFKMCYAAAAVLHAELNPFVPPLENHELQCLLSKGLCLSNQDMAHVFSLTRNESQVLDDLLSQLTKPSHRLFFLLDLLSLSLQKKEVTSKERESICLYASLLGISPGTLVLLSGFLAAAKEAPSSDQNSLMAVLSEIHTRNLELPDNLMGYYLPSLEPMSTISASSIKQGDTNRFIDACTLMEDIELLPGTTLLLTNVTLKMYGQIRLLGGNLIIEDSRLINKKALGFDHIEQNAMIYLSSSSSTLSITNSSIDCRHSGNFLLAEDGCVSMQKCQIKKSTGLSCIYFSGISLSMNACDLRSCHTTQNGAALSIVRGHALVLDCNFYSCEANNGGAVYTHPETILKGCVFFLCRAIHYGAAIYYDGEVRSNVKNCQFYDCTPEKEELIQVLSAKEVDHISREYKIPCSTRILAPVFVTDLGILEITNAVIYLEHAVTCDGVLNIRNSKIIACSLDSRDMFLLNHARICSISYSEFDGNHEAGIFRASGTKMFLTQSIFRNVAGGRAIFDANVPNITNCIFSYCQEGAISCRSGKIHHCIFINCTAKNGGAILMHGKNSTIEHCQFIRCSSSYGKEIIDITGSYHVVGCRYED